MSASSAATDGARSRGVAAPGLWASVRRARALDLFRGAVGASLALHFASGLGATDVRLVAACGAGVALSLSLSFGFAPRMCALALYGVSLVSYRALGPGAALDDYVANVAGLFLALLPVGGRGERRAEGAMDSVGGIAALVFLAHVAVLYAGGAIERAAPVHDEVRAWVARLIPIAFVAPARLLHVIGAAAQLGIAVHALPSSAAPLMHGVLAASAILVLAASRAPRAEAARWDCGGCIAALYALVFAIALCGGSLGATDAAESCRRVLSDFGLWPPAS